jgi:hypothetical protein
MKIPSALFKKIAILGIFAVVLGSFAVSAQTFTEPASVPPTSTVATPLNTGPANQTLAGGFWAKSVGANIFTFGSYVWDLEGALTTIHIQQLCTPGNCITSFPAASALQTVVPVSSSACNGGACGPDIYTAGQVCLQAGFTHVYSTTGGGSANPKACGWAWNAGTQKNYWACDSSCTTSCNSHMLTSVSCDNNGTTNTH